MSEMKNIVATLVLLLSACSGQVSNGGGDAGLPIAGSGVKEDAMYSSCYLSDVNTPKYVTSAQSPNTNAVIMAAALVNLDGTNNSYQIGVYNGGGILAWPRLDVPVVLWAKNAHTSQCTGGLRYEVWNVYACLYGKTQCLNDVTLNNVDQPPQFGLYAQVKFEFQNCSSPNYVTANSVVPQMYMPTTSSLKRFELQQWGHPAVCPF